MIFKEVEFVFFCELLCAFWNFWRADKDLGGNWKNLEQVPEICFGSFFRFWGVVLFVCRKIVPACVKISGCVENAFVFC